MKTLRLFALCASVVAACVSDASAAFYTFDISGLASDGSFGSQFPTLTHNFGGPGTLVRVSFNVNFTAFDPSWQSEPQIALDTLDDTSFDGDIDLIDYGAPDEPGTFRASGTLSANSFSSNGVVYLTLYEIFDDPITPDAIYGAGSTVTVEFTPRTAAVPEPSSLVLCGMASAVGLGAWSRRRRSIAA